MSTRQNLRLAATRAVLWLLVGVASTVTLVRYIRGLGATTALTDATPWGLWIGFDVLSGVALAAGGFVLAAAVYIFKLDRYHGMVRPAVLTAFLGYVAVALGLMVDLGRPWNIWRPILYWQTDSPLFEVAWCVMLYLTVLALEFAPVVFEGLQLNRAYRLMRRLTLPLVITGIALSTLHQSSLGTLFLLARDRLHPLWDSPLQPLLFFVSAVALGLAMVSTEAIVSAWLFKRRPEWPQVGGLTRVATFVLVGWAVLRLGDLAARGVLAEAGWGGWPAALFTVEMLIAAILPSVLFVLGRRRASNRMLGIGAVLAVCGMVLNRVSVGGLAHVPTTGEMYLPALTEIAVSLGLVAGMALIFLWCIEHLPVWEESPERADHFTPPVADARSRVFFGGEWFSPAHVAAASWIVGAIVGVGVLELFTAGGSDAQPTPIRSARATAAVRTVTQASWPAELRPVPAPDGLSQTPDGLTTALLIDGDRAGRAVLFDHMGHRARLGGEASCGRCHHRNLPLDRGTSCSVCHADMYRCTETFRHEAHVSVLGENRSCARCHPAQGGTLSRAATDCAECHGPETSWQPAAAGVSVAYEPEPGCVTCHSGDAARRFETPPSADVLARTAPGYRHVMHRLCIECHLTVEAAREPAAGPVLTRCAGCHPEDAGHLPAAIPGADASGRWTMVATGARVAAGGAGGSS